jgi:hypothetical protein
MTCTDDLKLAVFMASGAQEAGIVLKCADWLTHAPVTGLTSCFISILMLLWKN